MACAAVAMVLFCGVVATAFSAGASAPASAAVPPVSDGPADGTVLLRGSDGSVPLALTGSGEPGEVIHVSLAWADGALDVCDVFVAPDGAWACDDLPVLPDLIGTLSFSSDSGGVFRATALGVISVPTMVGDADDAARVTVDALAPWVSGSGTPGATVVVEVSDGDGCSTPVDASGAWGCALMAGTGSASRTVRAGQSWALDPAMIAWGMPLSVLVGASTVVGAPDDPGTPEVPGPEAPGPGSEPAAGTGGGPAGGMEGVTGDAGGGAAAGADTAGDSSSGSAVFADGAVFAGGAGDEPWPTAETPAQALLAAPAADDTGSTGGDIAAGTRETALGAGADSSAAGTTTTFGFSLRSPGAVLEAGGPTLVFTGAAALGLILLVMVPAGMLESTLEANSERLRRSAALRWVQRLPRLPRLPQRGLGGTVISVALVVAATAVLGAFVAPEAGADGGFLRLAGAFALASLVVNGLALALMAAIARASGSRLEVTANGHSVVVTALTVLLSRAALLQPGFVFGVAVGTAAADGRSRTSARVAAAGVVGLLVAGVGAWFAHAALVGGVNGGGGSFGVDVLAAMTVEALTGAVVAMIPLRFFAGADLWRGARTGWGALASLTAVAAMVALAPLPEAWNAVGGDTARWLLAFATVTAVTAGVWCWFRFVPERAAGGAPRRRAAHHRAAH
ncbi:hypothetical protein ACFJGV_06915 [Cnuibacter sp. UC19_7]|uniref:hypothetical protein n=1 Tax=Cnuibacter sp. UC19_7 TaxID=3350166 RepID=UPI0036720FB8